MTRRALAIEGGTPVRAGYLVFGRPSLDEGDIAAVADTLRSGWIGMGPRTQEFEVAVAEYCGARHAVAMSSCTAALHATLVARGIGPGDEVITSAMTFAATANAILMTGATPVLVDVDRDTLNMRPDTVRRAVTSRTRALMPVHFGGLACDMTALDAIAAEHGLHVVEDAAHALGTVHRGVRIGAGVRPACFSFYPTKHITTVEGGMVTTNDDALADSLKLLRLHGLSAEAWRRFEGRELLVPLVERLGFKYNMTDTGAALGLRQLARLETFLRVRERQATRYDEAFADLPVDRQTRPLADPSERHALHLYVLLLRLEDLAADRDQVVRALRAENIGAAIHYPALHQHPYYRELLGNRVGPLPVAEWVAERTVSLPLGPALSDADVEDVIEALRSVLLHYRVGSVRR